MREIRSFIGLTPEVLRERIGARRVVVWGGNGACVEVLSALRGVYSITQGDVLCMQRVGFAGFPDVALHAPDDFLRRASLDPARHFVIVASVGYRRQIVAQLEAAGASAGDDYLFARELFRQRAVVRLHAGETVDVAGIAGFLSQHAEAMAGATLEIAGLPDPLAATGCEALLAAVPSALPVTLTSHLPNRALASLAARHGLRLRLVLFADAAMFARHFQNEPAPTPQAFADLLAQTDPNWPVEVVKIGFPPGHPTVFPQAPHLIYASDLSYPVDFSEVLHYAESPTAEGLASLQAACDFDLAATLGKAQAQQDKPCMCERVFPVFRADGRLAVCHLHEEGSLSETPVALSYADLIAARRHHDYCRRCQAHGLHRFDVSLL